jgi:hypothetical protein
MRDHAELPFAEPCSPEPGRRARVHYVPAPLVHVVRSASGSTAPFPLPIPNDPAEGGLNLLLQGGALDPAANALGVVTTNGARAVVH